MKIALLGYGVETKAVEKHFKDAEFTIFDHETPTEFQQRDYSQYDIIFRSPSIPPLGLKNETTVTKYFFGHCPCPIIGVTATKGKGTICSFIESLLSAENYDVHLVGNIGVPALQVLNQLSENSIVVYELSSFQLWDLEKSPRVSVLGHLEPDHLNVHEGLADYYAAKSNILKYQTASDYLVYYDKNEEAKKLMSLSRAKKFAYPFPLSDDFKSKISLPGEHNLENAMAAIAAVACFKNISPDEYLTNFPEVIKRGLSAFHGLPHRLEFLRELNGVKYYDDNFSTGIASTRVAIQAFPNDSVVLILGGRDKTGYNDLDEIIEMVNSHKNIKKTILLGELGRKIAETNSSNCILVDSLEDAIITAKNAAEKIAPSIVLMSPAAASFDMFKNVYDRGAKFQQIISKI